MAPVKATVAPAPDWGGEGLERLWEMLTRLPWILPELALGRGREERLAAGSARQAPPSLARSLPGLGGGGVLDLVPGDGTQTWERP